MPKSPVAWNLVGDEKQDGSEMEKAKRGAA